MKTLRPCFAAFLSLAVAPCLSAATIQIDFGQATETALNWNDVPFPSSDIENLVDSTGAATGIELEIPDKFRGNNNSGAGTIASPADAHFTAITTASSLYIRSVESNGTINDPVEVIFKNLDQGTAYTFHTIGSRNSSEVRTTEYTYIGSTTEVRTLGTSNNNSEFVSATVMPDANGEVVLEVYEAGLNNFGYLNGIVIEYTAPVPEPTAVALLGLGLLYAPRARRFRGR